MLDVSMTRQQEGSRKAHEEGPHKGAGRGEAVYVAMLRCMLCEYDTVSLI
jgi:hypothetical protein